MDPSTFVYSTFVHLATDDSLLQFLASRHDHRMCAVRSRNPTHQPTPWPAPSLRRRVQAMNRRGCYSWSSRSKR
jgi:hypothetical protein